jgi:hypothetical protein
MTARLQYRYGLMTPPCAEQRQPWGAPIATISLL